MSDEEPILKSRKKKKFIIESESEEYDEVIPAVKCNTEKDEKKEHSENEINSNQKDGETKKEDLTNHLKENCEKINLNEKKVSTSSNQKMEKGNKGLENNSKEKKKVESLPKIKKKREFTGEHKKVERKKEREIKEEKEEKKKKKRKSSEHSSSSCSSSSSSSSSSSGSGSGSGSSSSSGSYSSSSSGQSSSGSGSYSSSSSSAHKKSNKRAINKEELKKAKSPNQNKHKTNTDKPKRIRIKADRKNLSASNTSNLSFNFTNKQVVVEELLCRWWFALPDWPPSDYDYQSLLDEKKLRIVNFNSWKFEEEIDQNGRKKVFQIQGYTGMFQDSNGAIYDLRPSNLCPSYNNFMKKKHGDLLNLLKQCYENQIRTLENEPAYEPNQVPLVLCELKNKLNKLNQVRNS